MRPIPPSDGDWQPIHVIGSTYMKRCGVCDGTHYGPLALDACPKCTRWAQEQEQEVIVIDDLAPLIHQERAARCATFPDHPVNPVRKQLAQVLGASLTVFLVGCLIAAALLLTGCEYESREEYRERQADINARLCAQHGGWIFSERVHLGGFGNHHKRVVTCADGHQLDRR